MAGRRWAPFEERFWARVQKSDGCWIWTGNRTYQGYGSTYNAGYYEGKREGAHRIAYRLTYGDFPKELLVCHHCDNPPCVRPDHLFLGSNKDNLLDAKNKGRLPKGEKHWRYLRSELTKRGYKRPGMDWIRGSRNHNSKLTESDVRIIRSLRKAGSRCVDLAKAFGIKSCTVESICSLKSWKHVH